MTGQEAYEAWRAAVPEFVCNVPGGPWDELSKAVRAGFDAIAARQQPAPTSDDVHVDWHMTPGEWRQLYTDLWQHTDTPYIARLIEAGKIPVPFGGMRPVVGSADDPRPASMLQPVDFDDEPELTEHLSVRFPAGMIAVAKQLAAGEGMTVSAWIRREVEREAQRREQPAPEIRTCYCGTTATVIPEVFPHRDCDGSVVSEARQTVPLAEHAEYIRANQELARSLHEATEPLLHGTVAEQKLGRELRERHGLETP